MLEALVERLLSRYLALYVTGISRDKLSVAVWSGDVELEDLQLKPEISDLFGLPFRVVSGRLKRIRLSIPWSKLGSAPVCLEIEGVHVLLEPKPIPEQTDEELITQLREAKKQQIDVVEQQLLEARSQLLKAADASSSSASEDRGVFFKFANKIVNSIQIDVRDIHIAFADPTRGFKIGVLLADCSVHNTDALWRRSVSDSAISRATGAPLVLYKACELNGLAVYCSLALREREKNAPSQDTRDDERAKSREASFRSLPRSTASSAASLPQASGGSREGQAETVDPEAKTGRRRAQDASEHRASSSSSRSSSPLSDASRGLDAERRGGDTRPEDEGGGAPPAGVPLSTADAEAFFSAPITERNYVLKPLHMRLLISHSTTLGELCARLEVKKESQGIEIGRTQLKAVLDISHEAAQRRRRCESLLLRNVNAVRLDAEGLKGVTEKEFIGLYTREIQASANLRGVLPLSKEEKRRLQTLYDVVGVRHLAKWQAICKEALTRIAEQTQQRQLLRQQELAPPPERLSWWEWATQGRRQRQPTAPPEHSDAAKPEDDGEEDQPLLTEEEVNYIVNSVQSDAIMENIAVPTIYKLSFDLVHFGISLRDDVSAEPVADSGPVAFFSTPLALQQRAAAAAGSLRADGLLSSSLVAASSLPVSFSSPTAFLAIELFNWSASLNLQNKQDASGAENSQWTFSFSLSNFCVRHRDQIIMHFRKDVRAEGDAGAPAAGGDTPGSPAPDALPAPLPVSPLSSGGGLLRDSGAATPGASPSFQQAAARLELSHDVTDAGNILGVVMRLAPLVASVRPDLLKSLLSFFVFEDPEDIRRHREREEKSIAQRKALAAASEADGDEPRGSDSARADDAGDAGSAASEDEGDAGPTPGAKLEEVEEMKKTEFVEHLKARGGTVYTAAVQRFPALLQIDVFIAAPILHFSTEGCGQVALQFGTLLLRTDGTCPYDDLRGIVELNETRIICQPPNQEEISLLRPIPIRVHLNLKRQEDLQISFLLEEIFLELTPEALAVLLAVPASVAKSLIEVKKARKGQGDADGEPSESPGSDDEAAGRAEARGGALGDRRGTGSGPATGEEAKHARRLAPRGQDVQLSAATVSAAKEIAAASGAATDEGGGPMAPFSGESELGALAPSKRRLNVSCSCCIDHCGFVIHAASPTTRPAPKALARNGLTLSGDAPPPPAPADWGARGREGVAVLRAEFCSMTVQLQADVAEGKYSGWAELQRVFVSDPSTASPLFLTLHETEMQLTDTQLYETMATSVQVVSGASGGSASGAASIPLPAPSPSGGARPRTPSSPSSRVSGPLSPHDTKERKSDADDDSEFQDAIEEREKSVRVDLTAFVPRRRPGVASTAEPSDGYAYPELAPQLGASAGRWAASASPVIAPGPGDQPEVSVAIATATVEVHWQQESIKQILETLREYKRLMQNKLQVHLEELRETAKHGDYTFLSKEAVAAMQETLHSVQQSLAYIDVQQHLNAASPRPPPGPAPDEVATAKGHASPSRRQAPQGAWRGEGEEAQSQTAGEREGGRGDERAEAWMASGLAYGGDMPPLATEGHVEASQPAAGASGGGQTEGGMHPMVMLNLKVKGAAIAFWKEKHIFSRMGIRDFEMQYNMFENGDGTVDLEVGGGAIIMEERCILAPRGERTESASSGSRESLPKDSGSRTRSQTDRRSSAASQQSASLFSARIRHYVGVDPVSKTPLPYSVCLQGVLHQVCYVYYQKDVTKLLEYLNDGIFNVFITKSYHAMKQAATRSYFLFAVEIACPVFILCEDKEIIPGYVPYVPAKKRDASARSPYGSPPPSARSPITPSPTLSRASSSASANKGSPAASSSSSASARVERASSAGAPSVSAASSSAGAPSVSAASSSSALAYAASHCAVDLVGLGSYITLDLGHLRVRNAYMWEDEIPADGDALAPESQEGEPRASSVGQAAPGGSRTPLPTAVSGDDERRGSPSTSCRVFTLSVEMFGLAIGAVDNSTSSLSTPVASARSSSLAPAFRTTRAEASGRQACHASRHVEGCLLETVDVAVAFRSSRGFVAVELDTTPWRLRLSRQQLTFVLDVVNENLAGKSYRPAPVVLTTPGVLPTAKPEALGGSPTASQAQAHGLSPPLAGAGSGEADAERVEQVRQALEDSPVRVRLRMTVPQLLLEASFGPEAPLALFSLQNVVAGAEVTIFSLYFTYRFVLCAQSFAIDDIRSTSANFYKRLAECAGAPVAPGEPLAVAPAPSFAWRDEARGARAETLRSGESARDEMQAFFADQRRLLSRKRSSLGAYTSLFSAGARTQASANFPEAPTADGEGEIDSEGVVDALRPAIKIEFASSLEEGGMHISIHNATIYLLMVQLMDFISYFTSSWAFSTMRCYPKPAPPVLHRSAPAAGPAHGGDAPDGDSDGDACADAGDRPRKLARGRHVASPLVGPAAAVAAAAGAQRAGEVGAFASVETEAEPPLAAFGSADSGPLARFSTVADEDAPQRFASCCGEDDGEAPRASNDQVLLPASAVLPEMGPRDKPFRITVTVSSGRFILYTDLKKPTAPILQWTNDFYVNMVSSADALQMKNIDILDCRIARLDVHPPFSPFAARSPRRRGGPFADSPSSPRKLSRRSSTSLSGDRPGDADAGGDPRRAPSLAQISGVLADVHLIPVLDESSAVLLCEAFRVQGHGSYRSVDAQEEYRKQKAEAIVLETRGGLRASGQAGLAGEGGKDGSGAAHAARLSSDAYRSSVLATRQLQRALKQRTAGKPPFAATLVPEQIKEMVGGRKGGTEEEDGHADEDAGRHTSRPEQPGGSEKKDDTQSGDETEPPTTGKADEDKVLLTDFVLVFDIPVFFLRVSSRDIALLLAAATTIYADTPSVNPDEPSPPVRPPPPDPRLLPSSAEKPVGAAASSGPSPDDAPPEAVAAGAGDVSVSRALKVDVKLHGVHLLLLDDLRASVVPLVRMRLSVASILIEKNVQQFLLRLKDLHCGFDYLNHRMGSWEPFVERFCVTAIYRFDYEEAERTRQQLQSKTTAPSSALSPSLSPSLSSSPNTPALPTSAASAAAGPATGIEDPWRSFKAVKTYLVTSTSPLWLNVTPELCKLLAWFVPYLAAHLGDVGQATERGRRDERLRSIEEPASEGTSRQARPPRPDGRDGGLFATGVAPDESKDEHLASSARAAEDADTRPTYGRAGEAKQTEPDRPEDERGFWKPGEARDREARNGEDDTKSNAAFRYVNLSGNCLYAFTLIETKGRAAADAAQPQSVVGPSIARMASRHRQLSSFFRPASLPTAFERKTTREMPAAASASNAGLGTKAQQTVGVLVLLQPTGTAMPLDDLTQGLTEEASRRARRRQRVYLARCPPVGAVDRLCAMFPDVPRAAILRNLNMTQDVAATANAFLVRSQARSETEASGSSGALSGRARAGAEETHPRSRDSEDDSRAPPKLAWDLSPAEIGPFPRGMLAVAVDIMRNCCVTLLPPFSYAGDTLQAGAQSAGFLDLPEYTDLAATGALSWASLQGGAAGARGKGKSASRKSAADGGPWSGTDSDGRSTLKSSASFAPHTFASRQFQKLKHSMSSATLRATGSAEKGPFKALSGEYGPAVEFGVGEGGARGLRPTAFSPDHADSKRDGDDRETVSPAHAESAAATAALHAQALSRTGSRSAGQAPSPSKTLGGIRRLGGTTTSVAGGPDGAGSPAASAASLPSVPDLCASGGRLAGLSGALGQRTTVGQASSMRDSLQRSAGSLSMLPAAPREREKSLILPAGSSGYRDFLDAAAAADDSGFSSVSELPGIGASVRASALSSAPRGAPSYGGPGASSSLPFSEEVFPFLPFPSAKHELVCEVISPHPSYKLLMVTSTVKLFNYSGLPLQFCFLDSQLNPLLLPCAEARKARTDAVYGVSSAMAAEGSASLSPRQSSFHRIFSSHPELRVVPPWLKEKELLIEKQVAREVQEQIDNVFLLDEDASLMANRAPSSLSGTPSRVTSFHALSDACGRGREEETRRVSPASPGASSRGGGADRGEDERDKRELYRATYSYTFLLEDKHFMSVPQPAILGAGWCYLCFRPAAFAQEGEEDPKRGRREQDRDAPSGNEAAWDAFPSPPDMSSLAGWTDLVDTRQRMEGLRCRQSAYVPPAIRAAAERRGKAARASVADRRSGAGEDGEHRDSRSSGGSRRSSADGVLINAEHNMYFLVNIEGRKSGLPAEKDIREISIFPALTLINAAPVDLDVSLVPSAIDMKVKHLLAASLSGVEKLQQMQAYPILRATLLKQSTFYAYDVPPNRQLKMKLKFARLETAGWSSTISDLMNTADEVVSRLLLPAKHFAPVELEVLRDSSEVASSLAFVQEKQLSVVISAPRCFIDRTGLGFLPVKDGQQYPVFDNQIILLGDSTLPEVSLVLPYSSQSSAQGASARASRAPSSVVQCSIDVPALGGFSHATAVTQGRCFTLCMNTEKIDPAETGGVLSRVVSLLPEYIISNFLHGVIYYRQYGTQGPVIEVKPNSSYPIYWSSADLPFAFQFRPGTTEGYAWSGPIIASEEFAGQNWLVLYNGIGNSAPGVFDVEVCPDNGVKSVSLRHSCDASGGYVLINKCKALQKVMVHTYHYEMAFQNSASSSGTQRSGSDGDSAPQKVPDFDFHFFAHYGESVHFGWPFPFTYASRPCQVLLWIDSRTVAPKKPIALDLRVPQHKRYEVSLGLRNMPRIIVRTEKRGDCVVIEIRSKPGTGDLSSPDGVEDSSGEDLTSMHLAINMAELGISLISESLRQELCFAELSQVALGFQQKGERQKLLVRLADIQIDNQLADAQKPVLLANRGGAGSSQGDAWGADRYASRSFLTIFVVRHHALSRDLALRRVHVEVDTLEVEIDADMLNGLNDFFHACLDSLGLRGKRGIRGSGASTGPGQGSDSSEGGRLTRAGVTGKELQFWVHHPLQDGYVPPPLPTVLSLESLVIERFDIYCWCSFVLDKMHMLSDLLKVGLRILMASGRLELMGARLQFQRGEFRAIRGSARTFLACLQDRYTHLLLSSIFSSLGQSSLLNLPRMPYEFGKNTIGLAANAVDSVSAGLGSLLSTLTFDSEYINRRQRERVRTASSMRDGFLNAGKNIGEGVWSLTNIVTKPIEGAQREGVGGFFKGIGKGLAGSLVKPLDKVGQAVSDMTRGIKAEVSKPLGGSKCRTERRRKPRMLWGEYGEIRPYDEREASLRECLGLQVIRRLLKCITVLRQETLPARHLALLFYPKDVFFVDLYGNRGVPPSASGSQSTSGSGGASEDSEEPGRNTRAYIVWHISIPLIKEVRASTHGIIIRTCLPSAAQPAGNETSARGGRLVGGQDPSGQTIAGKGAGSATLSFAASSDDGRAGVGSAAKGKDRGDRDAATTWRRGEKFYQVPCQSASLTRQIYQELLEAQSSTSAVVELGSWRTMQYAKYQDED
ncbi:hypothetical protein NCLIV_043020 [Neospora caninum Liverpool]|uniref:Vacuolar protein sorting-associated protein 13 n=1 Tax=Neospora caninum (strain Liverpool) TaxID=572307 RepID=F0VCA1_NEOCL|nr:hypothetical protein NCLIV_043020 [Neospora caninum Liverpool]CBZ51235.1 hypothetical protein NCLIV_043020 [Neospora caninum Liverpool]CEL68550.1 TPA: Vacuolar protein sorting-associated protein 13 [Neospora caninum Liverpool]|eukprot:XP_003881268.1 hypothetical protein NCLIV_043020 [Neospora caninum Liverpool]